MISPSVLRSIANRHGINRSITPTQVENDIKVLNQLADELEAAEKSPIPRHTLGEARSSTLHEQYDPHNHGRKEL